jgi:hypothetical protein
MGLMAGTSTGSSKMIDSIQEPLFFVASNASHRYAQLSDNATTVLHSFHYREEVGLSVFSGAFFYLLTTTLFAFGFWVTMLLVRFATGTLHAERSVTTRMRLNVMYSF